MKISVDKYIPFIEGVFEKYGVEVVYGDPVDPTDADALIIRTRTQCDRSFLEKQNPRIIATATIGFDHIDMEYCRSRGIEVATAAGCNARGVAQWVFAALLEMGADPTVNKILGVVGVGNVGSVVDKIARSVGFEVLLCDPPRAAREQSDRFVELSHLLEMSDIITMHVPLNSTTRGMVSDSFLNQIKPSAIFLNSSRGEIVDEAALLRSRLSKMALDVWGHEPEINRELLHKVDIATPHIAGYSLEGKAMGSAMAVRSVARNLGIVELYDWYPSEVTPIDERYDLTWSDMQRMMPTVYDIGHDVRKLKNDPETFELQRSNYNFRHELF